MAISLSFFPILSLFSLALAATVNYDFNVTWVHANPDGAFVRPVIGVNNQWPLPVVRATKGDTIIARVTNQLGNQSTSFHWHGIYQNGTTNMDGAVGVSQCAIPPGGTITYNFTVGVCLSFESQVVY